MPNNLTDFYRLDFQAVGINKVEGVLDTLEKINDAVKEISEARIKSDLGSKQYNDLSKELAQLTNHRNAIIAQQKALQKALSDPASQSQGYYRTLNAELNKLRNAFKDLSEADAKGAVGENLIKDIQRIDKELKGLDANIGNFQRNVGNYKNAFLEAFGNLVPSLDGITDAFAGGGGMAVGIGVAVAALNILKEGFVAVLNLNGKFSDLRVDVKSATGLTKEATDALVQSLKDLDTRTALEELLAFAEIGGKAGVSKNLEAYAQSVDKIKTALGKELGDNAEETVTILTKIINVFFRDKIDTSNGEAVGRLLEQVGNGIQVLANKGVATGGFLADFTTRLAGVKGILKESVTLEQILGLGAGFEELGQSAEVSSTAVNQLLLKIGQDVPKYAKLAGVGVDDFRKMVEKSPVDALIALSKGLQTNKKGFEEISEAFKDAELRGVRVTQVIGALGANADFFKQKIDFATDGLSNNNLVVEKAAEKQNNLAGALARTKNELSEKFVSGGLEAALGSIVGLFGKIASAVLDIPSKFSQASVFIAKQIPFLERAVNFIAKNNPRAAAPITDIQANNIPNVIKDLNVFNNKTGLGVLGNVQPIKPKFVDENGEVLSEKEQKAQEKKIKLIKKGESEAEKIQREIDKLKIDEAEKTAKLLQKIEEEKNKSRIEAIKNAEDREIELENERFQVSVRNFKKQGEEREKDSIEKVKALRDRLKDADNLSKKDREVITRQINDIEAQAAKDRLEIERQSNFEIQAETDEHGRRVLTITDKYEKERLKKIEENQKANAQLVKDSLDTDFKNIDLATSKKQADATGTDAEVKVKVAEAKTEGLVEKLNVLRKRLQDAVSLNEAANVLGEDAFFKTDDLKSLTEQAIVLEKQLTDAQREEAKARVKISEEETERRKKILEQLKSAAFDAANTIAGGLFKIQSDRLDTELNNEKATIEKTYAAKIAAAGNNKDEVLKIEKELDAKRRELEIKAISERATLAKTQAKIDGALAIIKAFATATNPIQGAIQAGLTAIATGVQIAVINSEAENQIAAIKAEQGAFIQNPNFKEGKDITGARHHDRTGGELQYINGRWILAEQGERYDRDEKGNAYVFSRQKTNKYRQVLDSVSGHSFNGKGSILRGIMRAETGAFLPKSLPVSSEYISKKDLNMSVAISDAQIALIAESIANRTGQSVYSATVVAGQENNRRSERESLTIQNATI